MYNESTTSLSNWSLSRTVASRCNGARSAHIDNCRVSEHIVSSSSSSSRSQLIVQCKY